MATVMMTELPGAIARRRGKIRDVYEYGDRLLLVATDAISAFDVVMRNGIPGKGQVLTHMSRFWFGMTGRIVANHLISTEVVDFPEVVRPWAHILRGRSMWCRKAEVIPIECVVRGYLAGSGWKSYLQTGEVCGHVLPAGLVQSGQLETPIWTPATKAELGSHDENISPAQAADIVGPDLAERLERTSLALYNFAAEYTALRGFLLCDTKFEFGLIDGELVLIDELLTPDSSRYWDASKYEPGRPQESYDKQFVRDYLEELVGKGEWNKEPPGPRLPEHVVLETMRIYQDICQGITGEYPRTMP